MQLRSVIFRFQNANTKAKCKCKGKCIGKCFYALNAAFISWMPLRSVIFWFQNANTKAKCKCKGKCIGKWFLCPKCGIYLLNAALKRNFSISECKYKSKMQMIFRFQNAKANASEIGFYALNAAFISWMPLRSVIFWISECKYKGKMQRQRQMHRKIFFMP